MHCANPADAHIIISNIRMRKRLQRHLDWNIARQKVVVTPQWLRDSVQQQRYLPCEDYAALSPGDFEDTDVSANSSPRPPQTLGSPRSRPADDSAHLVTKPTTLSTYTARYACLRASPLVCPNQALVVQLGVLRMHRDLEGKWINALSYERAISTIKAFPYLITLENFETEVRHLPHLGQKIQSKVKEFVQSGAIEECHTIRDSPRFQSLKAFTSVHGIGTTTARSLYNIGLRTLEDLEQYYNVPNCNSQLEDDQVISTSNVGRRVPKRLPIPDLSIKVALMLRRDLAVPIPRTEVEEIYAVVTTELEGLQRGCISTVVGGYRRGKPQSNDVDIVITHPDLRVRRQSISAATGPIPSVKTLCEKLVQRLHARD